MTREEATKPICPLAVAEKLRAIRQLEFPEIAKQIEDCPRLVEMLWFLQWKSHQPGGLAVFAREMLEQFPDWFITDKMHAIRKAGRTRYNPKEAQAVLDGFRCRWSLLHAMPEGRTYLDYKTWFDKQGYDDWENPPKEEGAKLDRLHAEAVAAITPECAAEVCRKAAADDLALYLASLCLSKDKPLDGDVHYGSVHPPPCAWWTHDLIGLLFACMDRHAAQESGRLVKTETFRICSEAIDYALSVRDLVTLRGDSRFGKTVSFDALCRARPGAMRNVTTPPGDRLCDLFRAIAEAFYINVKFDTRLAVLREPVRFILQHGGIGLAFDESHFLSPTHITKQTRPERLNWLRASLDKGLPLLINFTPQFDASLNQMVRVTGYNVPQWLGRPAMEYNLPESVSEDDMLALARHYLGDIRLGLLKQITGRATGAHTYLKGIENVAKRARFLADREGCKLTEALIERAMNNVLPSAVRQTPRLAATSAAAKPLPLVNTSEPHQRRTHVAPLTPQGNEATAPRFSTEQLATQGDG